MASLLCMWKNLFKSKASIPKVIPNASFVSLPRGISIEEENLPHYEPEQYYPVRIGEIFNSRYHVIGKLGYGAYSTSWVCHDMQDHNYKVVKVSTSLRRYPTATNRELRVYEHLSKVESAHPGQSIIRELYDTFDVQGTSGTHLCLIQQPMNITLLQMTKLNSQPFSLPLLKLTLRRVLLALDFLHTEANVVHTDLKPDNVMLILEDKKMLEDFAVAEAEQPSPRKEIDNLRTIYRSRKFRNPKAGKRWGLPIVCDFGEARIGAIHETHPRIQPHFYRAPEVMFEMPWGSQIDIWNIACLAWDLFEGRHLFNDIFDVKDCHDPFKHLALMVALIGPPPSEFVKRSETTDQCFDTNGTWIANEHAEIPSVSFTSLEKRLSDREQKLFVQFIRSMLKWLPEDRPTAKQLLEDPWLKT